MGCYLLITQWINLNITLSNYTENGCSPKYDKETKLLLTSLQIDYKCYTHKFLYQTWYSKIEQRKTIAWESEFIYKS